MKYSLLLLSVCTLFSTAAYAPKRALSAFDERASTTLRLELTENGLCSGTTVAPRVVLTATHCFQGAELISLNGQVATITHREDDGKDHTLIWVDLAFPVWAEMGGFLRQGDPVEYWGNPYAIPNQYRKGVVSGPVMDAILLDINGWKGDSGAGVFKDGKVVTVITGIHEVKSFGLMVTFPLQFTEGQLELLKNK